MTSKDGRAGIPFFDGAVPVLLVSWKVQFRLVRLHFRFLHAEEVGVALLEKVVKSFA